jgi:hypothetical protein
VAKITRLFVVNSFHKVAKIYSLLEFFRNRNHADWMLAMIRSKPKTAPLERLCRNVISRRQPRNLDSTSSLNSRFLPSVEMTENNLPHDWDTASDGGGLPAFGSAISDQGQARQRGARVGRRVYSFINLFRASNNFFPDSGVSTWP